MTKAELKSVMESKGAPRDHAPKEWDEAFRMYNEANKSQQLRRGACGSCYRKVWEWMSR
jgi:hypothetical protein